MSQEQTSILTFNDLILEVAFKLGVAYYGADGTLEPAIPIDKHDLLVCKRIVNDAIRMFIHDAPMSGWNWLDRITQIDLWPQISSDATLATAVTASYSPTTNRTLLILTQPAAGTAAFFASMEYRQIWLAGNPATGTPGFFIPPNGNTDPRIGTAFTVVNWISSVKIEVNGDATAVVGAKQSFSFASSGDYTMPANFGGAYNGEITYIAQTNRGVVPQWVSESEIRTRRQNYNIETGTPYWFAVRQFPQPSMDILTTSPARERWELMSWRISSEFLSVLVRYPLHFNSLVNLNDVQPAPFAHDETVKAACLAVAEKKVEDTYGPDWQYYRSVCLANSYRVDAQSRSRALGYFGNPSASSKANIHNFRDYTYQRPNVPVN